MTTPSTATTVTTKNETNNEINFVGNLYFVLSLHLPEETIVDDESYQKDYSDYYSTTVEQDEEDEKEEDEKFTKTSYQRP